MKKDGTSIKQNGLKICCKKQSDIPFKDPTRNQKRSIASGSGVFCVVHGGEDKRSLGGGFCCGEDRKSSTKAFNMVGYCLAKQLPPISRADQTSRKVNIPTFFLQKIAACWIFGNGYMIWLLSLICLVLCLGICFST